jgi:hypothetical protein
MCNTFTGETREPLLPLSATITRSGADAHANVDLSSLTRLAAGHRLFFALPRDFSGQR